MVLEFLRKYTDAESLDELKYASSFPREREKADFLLFRNGVICEVKDKRKIDIPRQVERVWKKRGGASDDIARDVSRPIIADLHDAARQIRDTRDVLHLPDALGLAIIENHIPKQVSSAVFIAAADSEMQRALPEVDAVLCLDFVNTFTRSPTDSIRLAQLVCRPGERSKKLSQYVRTRLMPDFAKHAGIPIRMGYPIEKLHQRWVIDEGGRFQRYEAEIDFNIQHDQLSTLQQILRFVAKWAWVFGLLWVLLAWFIHKYISQ
jgi:hypothetical protein